MKVCVTGLRGIPGVMGGVETHCEELLPRIAAMEPEIEIEVCCRAPYVDPAITSFRHVALKPLYSPTGRISEALVSTFVGIVHARLHGADAVHIHAVGPALLAPFARLLGLRVLLTHHGADYDREKWGRGAKLMLKLGEWLGVQSADRVVCVSPSLAARMRERYPARADRVEFIPNGVSTMPPSPQSDEDVLAELDLRAQDYVLCVARLVPEKGIHYLVEAFRRSGDGLGRDGSGRDGRTLVIAGAGRKDDRYAQDLLAMAEPRIRFLGMVPRPRLGVLLRNTALFVLPSFHEACPSPRWRRWPAAARSCSATSNPTSTSACPPTATSRSGMSTPSPRVSAGKTGRKPARRTGKARAIPSPRHWPRHCPKHCSTGTKWPGARPPPTASSRPASGSAMPLPLQAEALPPFPARTGATAEAPLDRDRSTPCWH